MRVSFISTEFLRAARCEYARRYINYPLLIMRQNGEAVASQYLLNSSASEHTEVQIHALCRLMTVIKC